MSASQASDAPGGEKPSHAASAPIAPKHRQLRELLGYWLRKKGTRRAPARAHIDPAEIVHLLPFVGLVDVTRDPLRFRFRLVGTAVVAGYGQDITGRFLDEIDLNLHERDIIAEYVQVAESWQPVCARWAYVRSDGRHVAYERLALPLSSDGKTVDMLFGGCVFDLAFG
jgi:hypothetical protein